MPDDPKKTILSRRARFIAAAMASAAISSVTACDGDTATTGTTDGAVRDAATDSADDAQPQVCLSPLPPSDAGDG
jgi:hypothetical protein